MTIRSNINPKNLKIGDTKLEPISKPKKSNKMKRCSYFNLEIIF